MISSVEVQFSGNARTYHYQVNAAQWSALEGWLVREKQKDCRVVVPGKVKDGRLSLSIANVLSVSVSGHAEAVLPIVSLIEPDSLSAAKAAVETAEAQVAATTKALT